LHHVRTLGSLLLTNAEARKIVSDFSVVARDLLARGAAKTAAGLAPTDEELREVDQAHRGAGDGKFLPKDQVKTDGDRVKGFFGIGKKDKTLSESTSAPGIESSTSEGGVPAASAANPVPVAAASAPIQGTVPASSSAPLEGTTTAPILDTPVAATTEAADLNVSRPGDSDVETDTPSKKRGNFMSKFKGKGNEHYSRGREFLTEEYFPKDRRDQWIWRAKKVHLSASVLVNHTI
jgi:hypothetical protein